MQFPQIGEVPRRRGEGKKTSSFGELEIILHLMIPIGENIFFIYEEIKRCKLPTKKVLEFKPSILVVFFKVVCCILKGVGFDL